MGKQKIFYEMPINEEVVKKEIMKIWVNLFGNNPKDLTEDKIDIIESALYKILISKISDNDFLEDLIKEAIEKAGIV